MQQRVYWLEGISLVVSLGILLLLVDTKRGQERFEQHLKDMPPASAKIVVEYVQVVDGATRRALLELRHDETKESWKKRLEEVATGLDEFHEQRSKQ